MLNNGKFLGVLHLELNELPEPTESKCHLQGFVYNSEAQKQQLTGGRKWEGRKSQKCVSNRALF